MKNGWIEWFSYNTMLTKGYLYLIIIIKYVRYCNFLYVGYKSISATFCSRWSEHEDSDILKITYFYS